MKIFIKWLWGRHGPVKFAYKMRFVIARVSASGLRAARAAYSNVFYLPSARDDLDDQDAAGTPLNRSFVTENYLVPVTFTRLKYLITLHEAPSCFIMFQHSIVYSVTLIFNSASFTQILCCKHKFGITAIGL